VAAALKGHQLLDGTLPEPSLFAWQPFHLMTIEADLALGLWLVSGFRHQIAAWFAFAYFLLLAGASGYLLIEGSQTCGCFGPVAVKPWVTLVFNLTAVCALALCPRTQSKRDILPVRLHFPVVALVVLCFVGPYLLVASGPDRRITTALNVESGEFGETIILDVENWVGRRLPILKYLDGAERLEQGWWTVVLHQQDCEVCERFLRQTAAEAKDRQPPLALVEVVAVGRVAVGPPAGVKGALHTSLTGWRRWVVQTPTIVELDNGNVTKVRVGAAGLPSGSATTKEKPR